MGTTPNYGWTYPDPTDYVKDLPTDLGDLADEIDATVAGLGSGLTLISTQSFTTQSSIQINNCFTSTYRDYKIVLKLDAASTTLSLNFKLSTGGTVNSTNYYGAGAAYYVTGSYVSINQNNLTQLYIGGATASTGSFISNTIDIIAPQLATPTTYHGKFLAQDGTGYFGFAMSGLHAVSTSYDGFNLYTSTGTISGNVKIYGYEV